MRALRTGAIAGLLCGGLVWLIFSSELRPLSWWWFAIALFFAVRERCAHQ